MTLKRGDPEEGSHSLSQSPKGACFGVWCKLQIICFKKSEGQFHFHFFIIFFLEMIWGVGGEEKVEGGSH